MMVLLLHGFTGDRSTWDPVLRHWQPELPPHVALRAIDLPGHGEGPHVLDGWRANLGAVARAAGEGLSEAVVVGYSLGARVALGLLAEGWARRAVLIGVNPGLAGPARQERRAADAAWLDCLARGGVEALAARWEAQPLFATQHRADPEALARRRAVRRRHTREGLSRSLLHMGLGEMPDYWPELLRLAGRVAFVVGALDAKFRELNERAARCAGSAPLSLVDGAGHDVPLEQPAALAERLRRLVRAPWGAGWPG